MLATTVRTNFVGPGRFFFSSLRASGPSRLRRAWGGRTAAGLDLGGQSRDLDRVQELGGRIGLRIDRVDLGRQRLAARHLDLTPARRTDSRTRLIAPLPCLQATTIDHHRRRRSTREALRRQRSPGTRPRRRRVSAHPGRSARPVCPSGGAIRASSFRSSKAHPGTNCLACLTHGLTQDGRAVPSVPNRRRWSRGKKHDPTGRANYRYGGEGHASPRCGGPLARGGGCRPG